MVASDPALKDRASRPCLRLLPLLLVPWLVSCQAGPARWVSYPDDIRFAAAADSLGLTEFLALPDAEQAARAVEAARWQERALSAGSVSEALGALNTAVGLDPSSGSAWLELALRRRWYGDYRQAEDALAACRAALPWQTAPQREVAARAALGEAWLRYDRGEWKRGLAWLDTAQARGADPDAVELLRALQLTGMGRNRQAEDIAFRFAGRDHRAHWIYGVSFWRRGAVQTAHGIFTGTASEIARGADDFVKGPMRPATVSAAECYRDFATVEELLGNWWLARHNYQYSASFVPWRDGGAMQRIDHPILSRTRGRTRGQTTMPVWLAYDRYYVTGSLSAYTALAMARFEQADDPAEREFWGAAVLDAAGTCLRLDIHPAWAQRARGLVLATYADQQARARLDLEAAQRWFDSQRLDDLQTLAALGRLNLEAQRFARARPLLERAVGLAPDQARLWSDLALSYIQLGEPEQAMAALSRALSLNENLAVAWYNRGLLRWNLDDLAGARADLERAAALAPDDPEIGGLLQQVRRRLGS